MPITVLSNETVKLIKSTQVVNNVWSVVKELVENSLDANANNIEVYLLENGLSLIKVSDNGCGISKEDVPYMGLSSYTSKLTSFKDLESLTSYGFRGVALNSMCALANVSVTTKTDADQVAIIYNLNQNGEIVQTKEIHRNRGTTIEVKDLCKNFPVRRKILLESRYIQKDVKNVEMLIKDFSICNPGVSFFLQINGKRIYSKPIMKDLKEALRHVVGRANFLNLHMINHSITGIEIDLLVPNKDATNLSDIFKFGQSYIFINKRPVKQKDIEKIILKKLTEYFSPDHPNVKKSLFVVNINVNPAEVDVNLEPNKDKVLLHNKEKIHIILEESLSSYYGLQVVEGLDSNKENTMIQNTMTDETFDSDRSSISEVVNDRAEKEKRYHGKESKKFERAINSPDLSEPDSDDDVKQSQKKSRSSCDDTILEKSQFSVNEKNDQQDVTETLSQLPVVNLGEDFDLSDLNKNIGTTSVNVAEKIEKKVEETCKTDVAVEIGSDAWSRGQINGGGGVRVLGVNYADLECNNSKIETKHNSTPKSGFEIFVSEARSQIMRENPDAKEAEVANQITTRWQKELSSEERGYYRDRALKQKVALTPRSQKRSLAEADMDEGGRKIIKYLKNEKQENKEEQPVRLKKTILPWNITLQDVKTNFRKTLAPKKKQYPLSSITIIGQTPENSNFWLVKYDNSIWLINVPALLKESDEHKNALPCQMNATMLKQLLDQRLLNNSETDKSMIHHIHDC